MRRVTSARASKASTDSSSEVHAFGSTREVVVREVLSVAQLVVTQRGARGRARHGVVKLGALAAVATIA
jgi:hypothetical protein